MRSSNESAWEPISAQDREAALFKIRRAPPHLRDLRLVIERYEATVAALEATLATLTQRDVLLLADIAGGFSTVDHYDRLDDLRKRVRAIVERGEK